MFIICLLFRVRKTNFPLRNLRRLSANIVLVQERHRKSCCTPQKYCLCLGEKKYISVALLCAKFCRKETWLEKEGNQGFRFADDASPASVTNADTNFPSPPSPTTTIIIPAEKNSLHSSPAVHQPLPPGKGDLLCIIFFFPPLLRNYSAFSLPPNQPSISCGWLTSAACRRRVTPGIWCRLVLEGWAGFFFSLYRDPKALGEKAQRRAGDWSHSSSRLRSWQLRD